MLTATCHARGTRAHWRRGRGAWAGGELPLLLMPLLLMPPLLIPLLLMPLLLMPLLLMPLLLVPGACERDGPRSHLQ